VSAAEWTPSSFTPAAEGGFCLPRAPPPPSPHTPFFSHPPPSTVEAAATLLAASSIGGGGGGGGASFTPGSPTSAEADGEGEGGEEDGEGDEGGAGGSGGGGGGGGVGGAKKGVAECDPREHLNVIHIGHVDSGKSTLSGSILFHTGQVDARTIEKYEREAKQRGRESWWLAFILDTTEEERSKGITVEVGRAHFTTPNKRFTILDAPGHKSFVANMIAGAAQADIAVLVISARRGEFETGFERGGQTREHALLAKTLGVKVLVVVVNKMDEGSVLWDKGRYDEITGKLAPFLKQSGYNTAKHVHFIPVAAITGANIKERFGGCAWYSGPSLLELLDGITIGGRDPEGPLRMPLLDKYIDRGIVAMTKVESGTVRKGQDLLIMPIGVRAKVDKVLVEDSEVASAKPGESVKLMLKGCKDEDVMKGFVLCDMVAPCFAVTQFEVQLMVMELDHRALFTAGYSAVLHVHTAEEEVTVVKLCAEIDKKTGEPKPGEAPRFVKSGALCTCILKAARTICVEKFETLQQMGRFTLRDEGRTLGIGKVLRLGLSKEQQAAAKAQTAAAGSGGAAP
jgi:peptide chain release factor subunit 3